MGNFHGNVTLERSTKGSLQENNVKTVVRGRG
jgi:hypothetical protein